MLVTTLPPAKLRALITLYHRSSSFITPANLSSRIDHAFTDELNSTSVRIDQATYKLLQTRVKRNRETGSPSLLYYRQVALNRFEIPSWSGRLAERQALISATLWGVQPGGKPSLETVQETIATNEKEAALFDQTDNSIQM